MAEEVYVGIDVSKAELVVAIRPSAECLTLANNPAGIQRLVAKLHELKAQLVVIEATGGLQRQVVAALSAAEIAVAVVNPAWVRNFAKGRGLQAKTDRKDAELLALYAEREPPHWPRQQFPNVPLQVVVGGKADRVLHLAFFRRFVDLRLSKGRVTAEDHLFALRLLPVDLG